MWQLGRGRLILPILSSFRRILVHKVKQKYIFLGLENDHYLQTHRIKESDISVAKEDMAFEFTDFSELVSV